MSLSEEKIKEIWSVTCGNTQEEMRVDFAHAIEAAVREEQSGEIAKLRESNAELLEGLRQIAGWNTDNAAVRIARELIAKHGGK